MSNIICISNRALCQDDFINRLCCISQTSVSKIILREKDLSPDEYKKLVLELFAKGDDLLKEKLILHSFYDVAIELGIKAIHMPLHLLEGMPEDKRRFFEVLGASCHSVEDALHAVSLGCTYITAGHVFDTDCKKGLPGRGLQFLEDVCKNVDIPVYAIGGINLENIKLVTDKGASGGCIMSGLMLGTVLLS